MATVFTKGNHEEGKKEDRAALQICSVEHRWHDHLDAPFRSSSFNSFSHLVLGRQEESPADLAALLEEIRPDLTQLLTTAKLFEECEG